MSRGVFVLFTQSIFFATFVKYWRFTPKSAAKRSTLTAFSLKLSPA
jgi:hypothetical protein